MAKSLYSMGIASGRTAGAYASKKTEASSAWDEMDFTKKRESFEQEKLSRKVETIGAALEIGSTLYGGYQDKQKFETRSAILADKYGDLQADTRSFKQKSWDFITGKEKTYTYGEGDSAKTFSRAGVHAQGGMELGESMLDETGFGLGKTETPVGDLSPSAGIAEPPLDDLSKKSGDDTKSGSKYDEMMSRIQQYRKDKWAPDETIDMSLWDLGEKSITNPLGVGDDDTKISFIN
jgi:hypothetical protein|tara:strand:+ start:135 stop:839 length:705 start_codon:yes stop_codon:yes gene_type:complete